MDDTVPEIDVWTVARTVSIAVGLTVLGTGFGLVGAILVSVITGGAFERIPDVIYIVSSRGTQFGFGAFALIVIAWTGDWGRYARFEWPELRDVGWIVLAFVALLVVGVISTAVLSALGVTGDVQVGASEQGYGLATPSLLWIVAALAWFGLAAPAEELFYRGLVQTRLRPALPVAGVVVVSAAVFALSHAIFAALAAGSPATIVVTVVELFAAGLVFAGLYEATDNLVPVAVFHALTWLEPIHVLAGWLSAVV